MYPWDTLPDFGVTPVINLALLTCSQVARLRIAEVLISQKRETVFAALRRVSVHEALLAVYSGSEIPWQIIPQPDCILISVITTRSALHLEITYHVT